MIPPRGPPDRQEQLKQQSFSWVTRPFYIVLRASAGLHTIFMQSINPSTEAVLDTFEEFSDQQVDSALQQAHDAQRSWRATSFGERAARLQAVARVLRTQKERWATLATNEMGKPIVEAEAEIEKCAWNCDF